MIGIVSVLIGLILPKHSKELKNTNFKCVLLIVVICIIAGLGSWYFHENYRKVPNVADGSKTVSTAQIILDSHNFIFKLNKGLELDTEAIVTYQSIKADTYEKKETTIECGYEKETDIETESTTEYPSQSSNEKVIVPDVVNMEQNEAVAIIHESNLEFQVWWTADDVSSDGETYYVKSQKTKAGTSVDAGTIIELEITNIKPTTSVIETTTIIESKTERITEKKTSKKKNTDKVTVPNVIGMQQDEAIEKLTSLGLDFQVWWTEEDNLIEGENYVKEQSIDAGIEVPKGTIIKLRLEVK